MRSDGAGNDFKNVKIIFSDSAAGRIVGVGGIIPAGTYLPDQPLAPLNDNACNGVWALEVSDVQAEDTGSLAGWSLTFA